MKKDTIEFIQRLLADEIQRETIQDSPNVEEIEYTNELVKAALDFYKETRYVDRRSISRRINKRII